MREFRYFATAFAVGIVTVSVSTYQTEKLGLATSNTEISQLALAAPDVPVPMSQHADRGSVSQESATAMTIDVSHSRSRAAARTARRLSTAQNTFDHVTSDSRRDVRGAE